MAETIGRAYIKILADGSGLPSQIEKEFAKANKAAEKGGEENAEHWSKGVEKGMVEHRKEIINSVQDTSKDLNTRAGVLGKGWADELTKSIQLNIKKNTPALEKSSAELAKRISLAVQKDYAATGRTIVDVPRRLQTALADMRAEEDEWEKEWRRDLNRISDTTRKIAQGSAQDLVTFQKNVTKTYDTIRTGQEGVVKDWGDFHTTLRRDMEKTGKSSQNLVVRFDAIGDGIGRAFGKGSRNNFLNFFGSVIGNIARLPSLLARAGQGLVGWAQGIGAAFTDVGGGFTGFLAAGGKIAGTLATAGFAMGAFVFVLGTVTSALLLTAGAAAALASAIAFGLVGAVAPLVGLLGPLSLAGFAVAASFIGMSDAAQKATKEAFEPLKDELKSLGDAARPGILDGITRAVENLEEPMQRLRPLFRIVGDSIGDFMDISSRIAFGRGFTEFVDTMSKHLPDTMRTLGRITGHVFDGLAGTFATLQPFTSRFLEATNRIAANFDKWSISPAAADFFAKAADSADALLDFLRPVWDLTMQILDAGRGPGNELFRSMGNAVQGWVDAINRDPTLLSDFFDDAVKMGKAIGDVVVAVGKLIGALDTPATRDFAIGFVKGFADVVSTLAEIIGWFGKLDDGIQSTILWLGVGAIAWKAFSASILTAQTRMSAFVGASATAQTRMTALGGAAKTAGGVAGLGLLASGLMSAAGEGNNFSNVLQNTVGGALTGLAVGGPIGALVGALVGGGGGALLGALHKIEGQATISAEAIGHLEGFIDAKQDAEDLTEALLGVVDAYGNVARAAIEKSFIDEEGNLDQDVQALRDMGVSMDLIVSAAQGAPGPLRQVTDTLTQGLGDAKTAAEEADAAYRNAKDGWEEFPGVGPVKVTEERLAELKDTAEDAGLKYDDLSAAASIFGIRTESINAAVEAHQKTVKELKDSLGLTRDQYNKLPQKVRIDLESRGLPETADGVVRLIDKFKGLRNFKDVKMLARIEGVDLTVKDIQKIARQAKLSPKQIKILTRIENAKKTNKDLGDITRSAKEVGRQKPVVRPRVEDGPAKKGLKGLGDMARDVDRTKVEPKVGIKDESFKKGNKGVKDELDKQDKRTVSPKITVNNTQALNAIQAVHNSLNALPSSKTITVTTNYRTTGHKPTASGGLFLGPENRLIGEAGAEAVVPLSRPLAMVDPAVRQLSAIAQGLAFSPMQETRPTRATVDVGGITVISPQADPRAVAQEMMNHLVATGY